MAARSILVRVHAGNLEPLEQVRLEEGSELRVILELPEVKEPRPCSPAKLRSRHLGIKAPVTRDEIYEDVG
jgi:predicted DNA-binding antitoxin AbrB/MazE fold protein